MGPAPGQLMGWALAGVGFVDTVLCAVLWAQLLDTAKVRSLTESEYGLALMMGVPIVMGVVVTGIGVRMVLRERSLRSSPRCSRAVSSTRPSALISLRSGGRLWGLWLVGCWGWGCTGG
jgi:putative copper export protein